MSPTYSLLIGDVAPKFELGNKVELHGPVAPGKKRDDDAKAANVWGGREGEGGRCKNKGMPYGGLVGERVLPASRPGDCWELIQGCAFIAKGTSFLTHRKAAAAIAVRLPCDYPLQNFFPGEKASDMS